MKKSILFIALISVFIVLSSCSVTQEIRVEGKPGTSIYDSNGKMLSTIDYSGATIVTIDRADDYHYFLQAKAPDSNILVPFAVDYTNHSRVDQKTIEIISFCIPPVVGYLTWGLIAWHHLEAYGTDNDFDYLRFQKTNNDLVK